MWSNLNEQFIETESAEKPHVGGNSTAKEKPWKHFKAPEGFENYFYK